MKKLLLFFCGLFLFLQANAYSTNSDSSFQTTLIVLGLIFFYLFIVWKGIKKPLLTSIVYLGSGIITTIYLLTNQLLLIYEHEMKTYLTIFIIIFFVVGFLYLYVAIEMKKNIENNNQTNNTSTTKNNSQSDIFDQINSLNELKEKGIINEAEFEEKKQKLLSKI